MFKPQVVVLLLCMSLAFSAEVSLHGVGASFPWPLYTDWIYAYSLVNPQVYINYTATTWAERTLFLTDNSSRIDFYSPNALLSRDDAELLGKEDSLQLVPLTIGSMGIIYNIPGLAYLDGTEGNPQLVLSTDVIADIYRGRINDWNDSRIVEDNPDLYIPERPISRIFRRDGSGYVYAIQSALANFVDDWEYEPTYTWPTNITSLPRSTSTGTDFGMFSLVSSRNYSIAIVPFSQLVSQKIAIASTYALVKNKQGAIVSPEEPGVMAAQDGISFNKYMLGNFTNPSSGYPLVLASYLAYRTDIEQDCAKLRELFKFMYWSKTSPDAETRANELGYSRFNQANNQQIIDFLLSATCNQELLLATKLRKQHEGAAFPAYLGLSLIFLAIAIVLGAVWQYLNKSRCSKVVVVYQAILLVGITMTYLSVIFWWMIPSETYICELRVWMTTLGYSLILTACFERTWQIKRVYGKVVKGTNLTANVTGFLEVGGGIAFILAIQFIIMITWTAIDPFYSVIDVDGDYTFEGDYECSCQYGGIWLLVEAVYFAVLLIWAIWVVYTTWSIRTFIVESRWILIAMYNILLFLALLSTLYATLYNVLDDDLIVNVTVPFILLSTTTIVVAVYAPSVLKEFKLIVSTDSSANHTKGSKTEESVRAMSQDEKVVDGSNSNYDIELKP